MKMGHWWEQRSHKVESAVFRASVSTPPSRLTVTHQGNVTLLAQFPRTNADNDTDPVPHRGSTRID